jgi:WD40 repeat protein
MLSRGGVEVWSLANGENDEARKPFRIAQQAQFDRSKCGEVSHIVADGMAGKACRGLAFTNDDQALALVDFFGEVLVSPVDRLGEVSQRFQAEAWVTHVCDRHACLFPSLAVGSGGQTVAQCPCNGPRRSAGQLSIWNLEAGRISNEIPLRSGEYNFLGSAQTTDQDFIPLNQLTIQFDPNCRLLAALHGDELRLWDLDRPSREPSRFTGGGSRCVAFNVAGDAVATGGRNVRLWPLKLKDATSAILGRHTGAVSAVQVSSVSGLIATCGADDTLRVWNLQKIDEDPLCVEVNTWNVNVAGRSLPLDSRRWRNPDVIALPAILGFSPSGQCVVMGVAEKDQEGEREALLIVDLTNPEASTKILSPILPNSWGPVGNRPVEFIAARFASDEELLAVDFDYRSFLSASDASGPYRIGSVRRWRVADGQPESLFVRDVRGVGPVLTFSSNGELLSAVIEGASEPKAVLRRWSLNEPDTQSEAWGAFGGIPTAMASGPDGQVCAVGTESGNIIVWHLDAQASPPVILRGHHERTLALTFSSDGSMLASGGADRMIRVWNLRQPKLNPVVLPGHEGGVCSLAFAFKDRLLVSGGVDGTVRLSISSETVLQEMVHQQISRDLSPEEWAQYVGEDLPYETRSGNPSSA